MSSIKRALKSLAPALLACAMLVTLRAAPALSAPTPPIPVTACGKLSADNAIYQLTADISTSSKFNCLVLKGSHSALDLHGFNITGPGESSQGAGILVWGDRDLIQGADGTVSGFSTGAVDEGNGTVGDSINLNDNFTGLFLNGHTDRWTNMEEAGNAENGIWLWFCHDDCSATDFYAHDNGANGALVVGSEGAKLDLFTVSDNIGDGIHIGSTHKYDANKSLDVVDGFAGGIAPFGPNGVFGIELDTSEAKAQDQVTFVRAAGNTVDLIDDTANCGNNPFNIWFDNDYDLSKAGTVPSPACILASVPIS
jgi:hypothetical protein